MSVVAKLAAASREERTWPAQRIGRAAIRALHREAVLHPKPGLVSAMDDGAHRDMSLATFYRSIAALRGYFTTMAALGAAAAPWSALNTEGRAAESAMLRATGGVNTHRGAIFHVGLACAAAGALHRPTTRAVCAFVRRVYAPYFRGDARGGSHGAAVARRYGAGGARDEAARGFVSVRRFGLPAYRAGLAQTADHDRAAVHALFALIAHVDDTNLLWRGGVSGLAFAQQRARGFLNAGGALAESWRERALAVHAAFVARGLSPGGSADLLALTLFLHALDSEACTPA